MKKTSLTKLRDIQFKYLVDLENIHLFTTRSGPRDPTIVWNAEFSVKSRHFIHTEDTLVKAIKKMILTIEDICKT